MSEGLTGAAIMASKTWLGPISPTEYEPTLY
jgi:hypothetical protein